VEDAIAEYQTTIRLSREPVYLALAYDEMGTIYQVRVDYAKAYESYLQALKANPEQSDVLVKLGALESGYKPH
jgi:tetratricopeptide (TPR) repeat protein